MGKPNPGTPADKRKAENNGTKPGKKSGAFGGKKAAPFRGGKAKRPPGLGIKKKGK